MAANMSSNFLYTRYLCLVDINYLQDFTSMGPIFCVTKPTHNQHTVDWSCVDHITYVLHNTNPKKFLMLGISDVDFIASWPSHFKSHVSFARFLNSNSSNPLEKLYIAFGILIILRSQILDWDESLEFHFGENYIWRFSYSLVVNSKKILLKKQAFGHCLNQAIHMSELDQIKVN